MSPQLHTLAETGQILGEISEKTVRRLIASGELESCDVAPPGSRRAKTRVSDEHIRRFIAARTRKARRTA